MWECPTIPGLWDDGGRGAALEHLAGNQPEPEDARPLLRAMLTRAFLMLEIAKEHHASQEIGYGRWEIGRRIRMRIRMKTERS